jgi:hypothetical protein
MPTSRAALGLLAAALLLGACGGDDGDAGGATSTSSLDPGVTFEEDVTVPTTAPQGATTTTSGPGEVETQPNQVPEQFPADFPVPPDAVVEVGSSGAAEGEIRVAVDYAIARTDPAAVFAFYEQAVGEAGWSVLLSDTDGQGQSFVGQMVFETDTFVGNVLVSGDGVNGVLLALTATLPD